MLKQMCEPSFPGRLVCRTDVIPHVDGNNGCFVVLMDDHRQPIGQGEALVGDLWNVLFRNGFAGNRQSSRCRIDLGCESGGSETENTDDEQGKRAQHV